MTSSSGGTGSVFSRLRLGQTSAISDAARFLLVGAVVSSILRVLSRRRAKARFELDDVCAVAAAALLLANSAVYVEFRRLDGSGSSADGAFTLEREADVVAAQKLSFAFEVLYLVNIFLAKFSVLFLYSRFARTKGIVLHLRTTQAVCAATAIVCMLSLSLSCTPISDYWSVARFASSSFSSFSAYHCAHRTLLTYASGIGDVVTNALLLLVPIPLLLRIPLARAQKVGLSVLYFLGVTVVLTSALRFAARLRNVSDQQAMGWSLIEVALALLLASAPQAVGLLVLPLVDVDAEREAVLAAARRGAVSSASVGTPVFVRKLLDERDAMAGGGERSSWQVRPVSPAALV